MTQSFRESLALSLGIDQKKNPHMIAPLALAFIGDTIFDLAIRTLVIDTHDAKVNKMHLICSSRAKASAQAWAALAIFEEFTDEEKEIFIRARNTKPKTVPKNATLQDYCHATALEAVLGYLFLSNQQERMLLIISKIIDAQDLNFDHDNINRPKALKSFKH